MTGFDIPPRIEIDDLSLRPPTRADVPALVEACQDPEIPRWTRIPSPYGRADAEDYVARTESGRASGEAAAYLVVDAATDELVGSVAIHDLDPNDLTAEVGYYVAAGARGRGVATRAVGAVVDWGLDAGLQRIVAQVMVGNEASRRLLNRLGFVEEGVLRSMPAGGCGVDTERIDMHLFSLIPSDRF